MKTAISLPDKLYFKAEKTAQSMGISRRQLYAKALEEYIQHHQNYKIIEKLNSIHGNFKQQEYKNTSDVNLETIRNLTKND